MISLDFVLMISLDLMKSSEIRKAGNWSKYPYWFRQCQWIENGSLNLVLLNTKLAAHCDELWYIYTIYRHNLQ